MASFADGLQSVFTLCDLDGAIGCTCCLSDRHHTDFSGAFYSRLHIVSKRIGSLSCN